MPTWGQVLSPAEINDLIAYLGTLKAGELAAEGSIANGARLYADSCVTCHGLSGEGVDGLGSILRPSDIIVASDDVTLAGLIFEGHGEMPGQAGILSEQEVNDLVALLRSWQEGVAAETTTEEAAEEEGVSAEIEFLYIQQCATCHGMVGEGRDDKPALANSEFIQSNDDEAIFNIIASGRENTAMEGFSEDLTEDETRSLIQLIRNWQ
jgi:mono/diheme cytochrome c family protein